MFKVVKTVVVQPHPADVEDIGPVYDHQWQAEEKLGDIEEKILEKDHQIIINDATVIVAIGFTATGDRFTLIYTINEVNRHGV